MSEKTYTIRKEDTLSRIAERELRSARRWREIFALNRQTIIAEQKRRGVTLTGTPWDDNPTPAADLIFPGTVLRLP